MAAGDIADGAGGQPEEVGARIEVLDRELEPTAIVVDAYLEGAVPVDAGLAVAGAETLRQPVGVGERARLVAPVAQSVAGDDPESERPLTALPVGLVTDPDVAADSRLGVQPGHRGALLPELVRVGGMRRFVGIGVGGEHQLVAFLALL